MSQKCVATQVLNLGTFSESIYWRMGMVDS